MEWWEQVIQILILMVGAYLIYYARQKGKNQADKNDIKGITKAVEDVKSEYAVELEKIRAELGVFTSKKNVVFQEQKEAIIDFSSFLNKWTWIGLQLKSVHLNAFSEKVIEEFKSLNQNYEDNTVLAFSRLQLMVPEQDIVSSAHEAMKLTFKHQQNIITRLGTLIQDNKKFAGISRDLSSDELERLIEKIPEEPSDSGEKLFTEWTEVIRKFMGEVEVSRDEANKARLKFVDFAKSFLNQ